MNYTSTSTKGYSIASMAILFCLFSTLTAFGQVSGTVKDAVTGEAVIGVNISLKADPSIGTITDIDGNFTINANTGDTLLLSYIGYNSMEVAVTGSGPMNLLMREATELLNEVVVVGYGAVDKEDLTGVVSNIQEEDFFQGSLTSPAQLIQGKVAGVQINTNGEPGGGQRIRIRGGTSLTASSDPLIVIDGVPLDTRGVASSRNVFNFVNTSDVESITILKDASAAAIYGSRGANGVIMVTTKSGQAGKMKIKYNSNFNVSTFAGTPTILNTANFRNAISAKAPQEFEFLGTADTDWVGEVTQLGKSQEHNLSISGGSKAIQYLLSGGYLKSNGVLRTSSHEKRSIGAQISTSLFDDKLTIKLNSITGFTTDQFAPNVIGAAMTFDPTRPVFDESSVFGGYFQWTDPLAVNNPVATLDLTDEQGKTTRTLNSLTTSLDIPFVEGLSINSNLSYDYISGTKRIFRDPLLKDAEAFVRGGYLFDENLRNYSALAETFLTYKTEFTGINSTMELTAGHSWQNFDQENRFMFGNQLKRMGPDSMLVATNDVQMDSFLVANRLISFFGRANFTFNDKYLLTASLRRDGSSRFGEGNRWGLFPSVAVAWRILEEDFAAGLRKTFSNLKLRLSWGVTGNENIGDFLFKTFYSYSTNDSRYQFGDEFVQTLRGTGVDPGIKWEETASLNFGIDFGFWNDRISGSLDIYQKDTRDLLFTVANAAFTNLSDRVLTNIGEMENKGVELGLNMVMYDRKNFSWDMNINASKNSNTIVKLDNSNLPDFAGYETGGISGDVGQTIQILRVGESVETFRTYVHKLDANGLPIPDTEDTNGDGFLSLLDMYEDINEDGLINENDLVTNENAAPDLQLGLNNSFRYKNWDMTLAIRAHFGNYVYNNVASSTGFFERLSDRVTNNIDESAFRVNFKTRQLKSDYYIENASFMKVDNLSIGYNFTKLKSLRNLRLNLTVTNLLTVTGYSGLDPELPQFTGGIDNNLYPISRNFLIGLNVEF